MYLNARANLFHNFSKASTERRVLETEDTKAGASNFQAVGFFWSNTKNTLAILRSSMVSGFLFHGVLYSGINNGCNIKQKLLLETLVQREEESRETRQHCLT